MFSRQASQLEIPTNYLPMPVGGLESLGEVQLQARAAHLGAVALAEDYEHGRRSAAGQELEGLEKFMAENDVLPVSLATIVEHAAGWRATFDSDSIFGKMPRNRR